MQENNYCVYVHKKKTTGEIFYVGSGTKDRASSGSCRSKSWNSVVASCGFNIEIIFTNLSKKESLRIEKEVYSQLKDSYTLVNKRHPGTLRDVCIEYLRRNFYYDETSPTLLRHKIDKASGRKHSNILVRKGDVAGTISGSTRSIGVKRLVYPIHRIIWMLHHGEIPESYVIDHIDGNIDNNLISNLRIATYKTNSRNRGKPSNNTSGVVGVSMSNYRGLPNRWCASYTNLDGKLIQKYFPISKFGYEEAFALACDWRAEQIMLLNQLGADYTERHGT